MCTGAFTKGQVDLACQAALMLAYYFARSPQFPWRVSKSAQTYMREMEPFVLLAFSPVLWSGQDPENSCNAYKTRESPRRLHLALPYQLASISA